MAKLKAFPPFEFENWTVIALGGIPNKVQVGDMGIDGRIYPVGTKPADTERECAAFHKNSGRIIKLITVQDILDELHVQKM